jgi:hypothetical protein
MRFTIGVIAGGVFFAPGEEIPDNLHVPSCAMKYRIVEGKSPPPSSPLAARKHRRHTWPACRQA